MNHTVEQTDCLHLPLPDSSVDLVFTSPPYEDARTYGVGFKLKGQDWVDWAVPRFMECLRVCRGLVAWVVQGRTRQFRWSTTPILFMADLHRAGINLRCPPIFHRGGIPGSGGPDWWRNDYEYIICATQPGQLPWSDNAASGSVCKWPVGGAVSYRTKDGRRRNAKTGSRLHTKRMVGGSMVEQTYRAPAKANPGNVVHCVVGGGCMGSDLAHETEAPFPEKLVEPFVKCFCPPDGTVLDPFCGSGTTAKVALVNGRNAIAYDIRESQVTLTLKRIAQECPDHDLIPAP